MTSDVLEKTSNLRSLRTVLHKMREDEKRYIVTEMAGGGTAKRMHL